MVYSTYDYFKNMKSKGITDDYKSLKIRISWSHNEKWPKIWVTTNYILSENRRLMLKKDRYRGCKTSAISLA